MIVLIQGVNGSGKSRYAEKLASALSRTRYYVATMKPQDEEAAKRVQKHILQRQNLHFVTLECPYRVGHVEMPSRAVALLEDVSNLLANALFERKGNADEVYADIVRLTGRTAHTVLVTITGLDAAAYDLETREYIMEMERLNDRLAALADVVIEMRAGEPICRRKNEQVISVDRALFPDAGDSDALV